MTALVAAALLVLFGWLIIGSLAGVNDPPLLADPAPTAVPTPTNGTFPPQLRGAYDPNARALALIAVVGPLVTTIVGFYFGQRAGSAAGDASAKAAEAKADTAQKATTAVLEASDNTDLIDTLRRHNLL